MSTTLDTLQAVDAPPLTVAVLALAVAALVVTDPVLGRRDHRALVADVSADRATGRGDGEDPRVRFYRRWVRSGWAVTAAVAALVALLPGVGLGSLGFRLPDVAGIGSSVWRGTGAPAAATSAGGTLATVAGTVAGMVVGTLAATVLVVVVLRLVARRRAHTGSGGATGTSLPLAGAAALTPMLPTTARGRRGWASLSLMAGVSEEVTYRGLVVLTLALLLPGADQRVVVVVAAVLFGLAHAYQGLTGMLATGVVGAALTSLYLGTGSLLLPMVLHVLLDLRVLLLAPRPDRRTRRRAGPAEPAGPVVA